MIAIAISVVALILSGIALWKSIQRKCSAPFAPPAQDAIKSYLEERAKHPEGSPRYIAFTQRLESLGYGA